MGVGELALKGLKFADVASTLFGSGPQTPDVAPGASNLGEIPGPSIPTGLPGSVGNLPSGVAELPGASIESGTGAAGLTGNVADLLGITEGAAGSALGAAGAIPAVVMAALSNEPNWEKAVDSILAVAGGALAGPTFGISPLVAGIADVLVHLFGGQQGDYIPKRQKAFGEAKEGLGELAGVYQQAAQTGDPAQVLTALETGEAGGHIRSELALPKDVAAELGVTGFPRGNNLQIQWDALTPQQFSALLNKVQASDPSVLNQWIVGSGDVPYLPGPQAQSAADAAAGDARALLEFMTQQRQQAAAPMAGALAQAPASASATTPGGGGELMAEQELAA